LIYYTKLIVFMQHFFALNSKKMLHNNLAFLIRKNIHEAIFTLAVFGLLLPHHHFSI